MNLTDLLSADRVAIRSSQNGAQRLDKPGAIAILAGLLASAELSDAAVPSSAGDAATAPSHVDRDEIERVLLERERLQSTAIGEGVAIPHGALSQLTNQVATLLIIPDGIDFAAIDERDVNIIFAVIGPKRATGEHLKTLARVSRLLRNQSFREQLVASSDPRAAFALIASEEGEKR
jgi:PTS system nitrogen regulatory IIA component